jgi:hypothetical protein
MTQLRYIKFYWIPRS